MRDRTIYLISSITIILLISILSQVTAMFTSNPVINPGILTIYHDQDLVCHWTTNETGIVNVTWYKNSILNTTYNRSCTAFNDCYTTGNGIISQNYTTKGDIWTCDVSYYTAGTIDEQSYNVTIAASVPTLPRIFLSNGTEVESIQRYLYEKVIPQTYF